MPNLFPIGPAVWYLSHIFEFVTPLSPFKCPLGIERLICLAYVHSLMNLYMCAKCGPDRSSGLEVFPDVLIDDPLPCPSVITGLMFSSCPFPDEYAYPVRVPKLFPIASAVWLLSHVF